MIRIILTICYILLAPLIGGLLDGLDRKISARMQRRVGPPLLQPFYDVSKLLTKRETAVTKSQQTLMLRRRFPSRSPIQIPGKLPG